MKTIFARAFNAIKSMLNNYRFLIFFAPVLLLLAMMPSSRQSADESVYKVKRIKSPIKIDGNWNKKAWKKVEAVMLTRYMGAIPPFKPSVQAKMVYDDSSIYIIFLVHDRFVRSIVQEYNGPVSTDACVEFFFSPDTTLRDNYFNLEINAGGTPLMAHHVFGNKQYARFTSEDLSQIKIAHSLPKVVDPQITEPITWTIEYRLPLRLLKKYGSVNDPRRGTVWKGNFYKTASKSTNPHWITWSFVDLPAPSFHQPHYFGRLLFQ